MQQTVLVVGTPEGIIHTCVLKVVRKAQTQRRSQERGVIESHKEYSLVVLVFQPLMWAFACACCAFLKLWRSPLMHVQVVSFTALRVFGAYMQDAPFWLMDAHMASMSSCIEPASLCLDSRMQHTSVAL